MATKYETIIIQKPEATDEIVLDVANKVEEIIKSFGGEIIVKDDWGKLKTAFEVKGFSKGRFVYFNYTGASGVVAELERNLRNNDEVIRFLTVKLEDSYDYIKTRARLDFLGHKKRGLFGPNIEYKADVAADVEEDDIDLKEEV